MSDTQLTPEEKGITLELASMTAGTASSVLSMLIDQPVELTQPSVTEFANVGELVNQGIPVPSVVAVFKLQGPLTLPMACVLSLPAAIKMADMMMGGASEGGSDEISDIQLGAIGEALSQMMLAAANNLEQCLFQPVEMTNPIVQVFSPNLFLELMPESRQDAMTVTRYTLTAGDVIPESAFLQITPMAPLRQLIHAVQSAASHEAVGPDVPVDLNVQPSQPIAPQAEMAGVVAGGGAAEQAAMAGGGGVAAASMSGMASGGFQAASGGGSAPERQTPENPVTVRPVEFPSFDDHVPSYGALNKNLDLVMDVSLNLTVELGRTELPIKEVLELTRGSVIELNRIAGETVDLYANGKMIAKGEVVVIEDNFGLRITSIVSPADRLRGL